MEKFMVILMNTLRVISCIFMVISCLIIILERQPYYIGSFLTSALMFWGFGKGAKLFKQRIPR